MQSASGASVCYRHSTFIVGNILLYGGLQNIVTPLSVALLEELRKPQVLDPHHGGRCHTILRTAIGMTSREQMTLREFCGKAGRTESFLL